VKITVLKKTILWPAVLVTISCGTLAQQKNDLAPAPLEILKLKWEKQVRLPRNFDPSLIPTGAIFNDPSSRTSSTAPQNPLDATRAATSAQSNAPTASVAVFPATPGRLPVFYVYSMKVKNAGNKTIDGVAWDYVFIDAATSKETGRHQFLSYEKLQVDKTTTFRSQLRSPPTRVLQTTNGKSNHPRYVGKAIIQCVLYTDDTTWRGPQAPADICALLKTERDLRTKKRSAAHGA